MRSVLFASAILILLATVATSTPAWAQWNCPSPQTKSWRVSGQFIYPTGDNARDALSNGFGVEVERSLGALANGDLSAVGGYRGFSKDTAGFDNNLDYYSLGIKWRTGPGATPSNDGYYYGAGIGGALLNSHINGAGESVAHFEIKGLAGINFAKSWFTEVSYTAPSGVQGVSMNNIGVGLGYRF